MIYIYIYIWSQVSGPRGPPRAWHGCQGLVAPPPCMVWVRIARASCLSGFSLDESGWLFEVSIEKSTNIYSKLVPR